MLPIVGRASRAVVCDPGCRHYRSIGRELSDFSCDLRALAGLAVCEAPPLDNKVTIPWRLPRVTLQRLDCRHGLNEQVLHDFLAQLNRENP